MVSLEHTHTHTHWLDCRLFGAAHVQVPATATTAAALDRGAVDAAWWPGKLRRGGGTEWHKCPVCPEQQQPVGSASAGRLPRTDPKGDPSPTPHFPALHPRVPLLLFGRQSVSCCSVPDRQTDTRSLTHWNRHRCRARARVPCTHWPQQQLQQDFSSSLPPPPPPPPIAIGGKEE